MKKATVPALDIHIEKLYGAIVYSERASLYGVTDLPPDFVAVKNDRVLIAGQPHADIVQAAFGALGMTRAHITRHPRGEGVTGLMVDLVA